jgi:hypothetical protein
VAIGQMMNDKRKLELMKRRDMETDFKAVVGDVFDVIGVFNSESYRADEALDTATRVAEIASRLGNVLGLSPNVCTEIYEYSRIHVDRTEDLSIEDYDAKDVLTEDDYSEIRDKTILGSVIIKRLQLNQKSEDIVRAHFEKNVTPEFKERMKRVQRSQEGQIILMAEVYEILRQSRNYKTELTHKRALELLQLEFKDYFEPYILDRFIRYSSEFEDYYLRNMAKTKIKPEKTLSLMNKFKTALITPEALINFKKDRLFKVFLYMLFFAVLTAVGPLVDGLTYQTLPALSRQTIESGLTLPTGCTLINDELSCLEEEVKTLYQMATLRITLDLNSEAPLSEAGVLLTDVVLGKEKIVFITAGQTVSEVPYQALNFGDTLDFNGTEIQQSNAFFKLLDAVIIHYRNLWIPVFMVVSVISSLLIFIIFALINSALIKPRIKKLTFKELFVLMSYASTGLYLIWIFDALVPLNLFVFLILIIFAFRRTSRLALLIQMNEIIPEDLGKEE